LQIFFKLFQRLVDALAVGVSDTAIAPTSARKETDLGALMVVSQAARCSLVVNINSTPKVLQETEHFCWWRQQKVAKIVPYAPPDIDEGRRTKL
jgi:hypothetical protein